MSIDKFGRFHHHLPGASSLSSFRGLPGIGFKLTSNGDFDIEGKRLTNVAKAKDNNDATIKQNVLILDNDNNYYNAQNNRIISVANPIYSNDVTNKAYVDSTIIKVTDTKLQSLASKSFVEQSLRNKLQNRDSITKSAHSKFLQFSESDNNSFDAKNKYIINVADAINDTDVVNKRYLNNQLRQINDNLSQLSDFTFTFNENFTKHLDTIENFIKLSTEVKNLTSQRLNLIEKDLNFAYTQQGWNKPYHMIDKDE